MQKQYDAMWNSIEYIARSKNLSCSGLAQSGGLDPTTFNKSKRHSKYGQPRWLSMETIFKILTSTHTRFLDYAVILQSFLDLYCDIPENDAIDKIPAPDK